MCVERILKHFNPEVFFFPHFIRIELIPLSLLFSKTDTDVSKIIVNILPHAKALSNIFH